MTWCQPTTRLFVRLVGCAGLLAFISPASLADSGCSFSSVTPVNFGAYDVFAEGPNINGVGSLHIRCSGGGGPFIVTLSRGRSNSFAARVMTSGANSMSYNLFTSAARTVIWGDGTGGSSTMTVTKNTSTTLSIYGLIPAGQDVSVGIYTDSLIAAVSF